jgi:hypothetical protein
MLHIPPREKNYGIKNCWVFAQHINGENKQVVRVRLLKVCHFSDLRVSANTH